MKLKNIEKYAEKAKSNKFAFEGICHDCQKPVKVNVDLNKDNVKISGGALFEVNEEVFMKCESCFETEKELRNFQPCEVYSRVVGYLRPVEQWNKAKKQEYEKRKEFVI